jgi:DNA helicase II / ATP-dependent DNA helicase PcrA
VHPDEVLAGLNDAQRAAVTHPAETLAILAGAGSGKTRVLTRRIAHRVATTGIEPRHVLALTFTRKAAAELAARLRALGLRDSVTAGTFHGIAYAQLRQRWQDRGVQPPQLLDRKVAMLARLLPDGFGASPMEVAAEIEWAKARMVGPGQYGAVANAEGRRTRVDHGEISAVFRRYEQEKVKRRLVDFDDLLRLCCRDVLEDRGFAAVVHWRHRHLVVDEFQDVNPLQFALLEAWLGGRQDLTVVGDPHQAIYGWNGADAHYLTEFEDYFAHAATVTLEHNHRSSPQILRAAAAVLGGATTGPPLVSGRADGPEPEVVAYDDDRAEAAGIARAVRDLHGPGTRWSQQAILVRTHGQVAVIADALAAAGVPFGIRGGRALADEPEVRRALKSLAAVPAPLASAITDLEAELTAPGPDGPDEHQATVETLVRLARDYLATAPNPSVTGLEAWLRDTTGAEGPDTPSDSVTVCTFHAAKGLEWPVVHLAGLEQGFVPIHHARTPETLDEERRLLHVAVTRAGDRLRCTWARRRTFRTRSSERTPSPWLDHLLGGGSDAERSGAAGRPPSEQFATPELFELPAAPTPTPTPADRLAGARASLRAVSGTRGKPAHDVAVEEGMTSDEQATLESLREWRSSAARAANVADHVVFGDRVLGELARARPRTIAELTEVAGVGAVKATRWGPALLQVVHRQDVG